MKTFNDLAKECTEYAAKSRRNFKCLGYGGLVLTLLFVGLTIKSVYDILYPEPHDKLWFDIVMVIWNVGFGIFTFRNALTCFKRSKESWDMFMKERQKCLDLADQYRDY